MSKIKTESVLWLSLSLLLAIVIAFFCVSPAKAENLLVNGSFEETDDGGMPVGWWTDAYILDEGYSIYASVEDSEAQDGNKYVTIRNVAPNDARFMQVVDVEPNSLYCFSGYLKGEGIKDGRGANLSVEGLYVFSESVFDSDGEWQRIEWYGETGENQTNVTLFARLGGYSGESQGKACFDNLKLEKVDAVPGDGIASRWYSLESMSYYDDDEEDFDDTAEGAPAWPLLLLLTVVYSTAALLLILRSRDQTQVPELTDKSRFTPILAVGFLLALVLRVILSAQIEGYMVDVNCFVSWGRTMANYGPVGFYPESGFCDYPPAYVWVLGLNSLLSNWLGADAGVTRIIFRFIPGLCDLGACWVLSRFAGRRISSISQRQINILCLTMAFHPALILNSAAWGQMDSVLCLCLLLVAIYAIERKWTLALPLYMLSVMIKPQALMLGFLGLAALIFTWIREKNSRKDILIGLAVALGVAAVIVIPFGLRQSPGWLINQYAGTLGSYPYATVNTANYYYLFGGNWSEIGKSAPLLCSLILGLLCAGYGIRWTMRVHREQSRIWIEQVLTVLFIGWFVYCGISGASWGMIGTGAMAFAFLVVLSLYIRKGDLAFLPYLGALLFLLLYVFGVKMHERYVFPAFILLACAWMIHKDRRILTVLFLSGAAVFVNEGIVLDNSIRLGSSMGHLNSDTYSLACVLSVINILVAVYAAHIGIELSLKQPVPVREYTLFQDVQGDHRLHWKKLDTVILCLILSVYSLIAFTTLGSTKAPQKAWTSTDFSESVTLDLGEEKDDFHMLYFARVSRYNFTVAVSPDGKDWSEELWAEMNQGSCWKWKYLTESYEDGDGTVSFTQSRCDLSGRYVRITAHQIGLALCEVLFRDISGNILPVDVVERSNANEESSLFSDPACLIDEQDTFEGLPVLFSTKLTELNDERNPAVPQPSWWNSTYFDEIYHARTAYEFLHGTAPYETSHPPLGKILMSWGVAVWGMTPFGWRFAGALAGSAMLVAMYLIGKQLTKNTLWASVMALLMALDCMHLTQTQIATIDSFPVLFILFSYYFMLRFLQSDLLKGKRSSLLTNLGCSGLFMGFGIASKWIGIYAGAGLGVLFFTHCIYSLVHAENAEVRRAVRKRFFMLCAWCILFFVIVPAAVYLISYIPYFAYKHIEHLGEYLREVWNTQEGMFNYHATPGLGMDHPFYSPWYEWPVIGKPMFYATKQYVMNEELSHSIFCIGNPVIWLPAIATLMFCIFGWIHDMTVPSRKEEKFFEKNIGLLFLTVGFLAQYLPWMLVPRGTYIYHYFASVPFLILSLTIILRQVVLRNRKAGIIITVSYLVLAAAGFALFFPYAAGIMAPVEWLDLGAKFLRIWY